MIQWIVRDRCQGKTTSLLKWLLQGKATLDYPGWSRIIVCRDHNAVLYTTRMLRDMTQHFEGDALPTPRWVLDVRKCVWGVRDLATGLRGGSSEIEIALDDYDEFPISMHDFRFPRRGVVTVIAVNGSIYAEDSSS